jgi:hypothetical protein
MEACGVSQTLEQKVVAALDSDMSANSLGNLLTTLDAAITEADATAEAAKVAFLDPVASPDINKARAAKESTQFTADRLRTLLPRLEQKYQQVEAEHAAMKWRTKFDALKTQRDKLAAELAEKYPAAVATLADLFGRIAENDEELSHLHRSRPTGAKGHLRSAELEARELDEFSRDFPPLGKELRLPDFTHSDKLVWPPREVPASVLFAQALPSDHPRFSGDWHKYQTEDVERRRVEEQLRVEEEAAAQEANRREYERSLPR